MVRTVVANGITAKVWTTGGSDSGELSIDWRYQGMDYEMSAFLLFRPATTRDIDAFVSMWRTIQYSEPA